MGAVMRVVFDGQDMGPWEPEPAPRFPWRPGFALLGFALRDLYACRGAAVRATLDVMGDEVAELPWEWPFEVDPLKARRAMARRQVRERAMADIRAAAARADARVSAESLRIGWPS